MDLDLDLQVAVPSDGVPAADDVVRWVAAALAGRRERATLTVRIVGAEEGRALNRRFRGQDRPTNVLSFPFEPPPGFPMSDTGPNLNATLNQDLNEDLFGGLLGDLVICAPVVIREAAEQGKPQAAHWAHLVVHGTLHLLGYDHLDEPEAEAMEDLETTILGRLGFPPPYAEAAFDPARATPDERWMPSDK